ncbi:enoyl-CoA hydratase [Candidatus Spongiihabitans sp.]|uniref:enoyl-CoA hydratase n=1 Tax=Candidatus Spongiihabitans sp. TaxID=3101308 RepID=UPI003C6F9745
MSENNILLTKKQGGVTTLTLNRPQRYNALSSELLSLLSAELDAIAADSTIRAVVVAANGQAFCAGHDLKEMRGQMRQNEIQQSRQQLFGRQLFGKCSEVMMKLVNLPQPVIAKVQGMATAAGCQLVATCDLAVSADSAKFAVSGIRVGLFCATPAVALSRNINRKRALEMLMTGEFIDAQSALNYGLVNKVVRSENLDQAVDDLVGKIIRHPHRVVTLGKKMFYQQINQDLSAAYAHATATISANMMLDETQEGIDAFIEKRPPNWTLQTTPRLKQGRT